MHAAPVPEDDFDLDEHLDWLMREIDAGRQLVPPESRVQGPAISVSLGDAADVPPGLLAAICGPDGLAGPDGTGGEVFRAAFGQSRSADVLRPGPILAALTEQAFTGIASLTDDQLAGALHAAIRLENRAFYLRTLAVAEFTRRRKEQLDDARARKVPRGCRAGEYPDLELAAELLVTRNHAQDLMAAAEDLTTRLPRTLAGMADGVIDPCRAMTIAVNTASLTREDAARADEILARDAHEIRADTLARRAASLEMKLDPEAAKRRREHAKNTRQRVEVRREDSGNASLCAREMDTADAMAAKANIDAIAVALRNAGLDGTLDQLRMLAIKDLTQSRNPLDRIAVKDKQSPAAQAGPAAGSQWNGAEDEGGVRYPSGPGTPAGGLAPLPALINILAPASSLLGWGTAPGQAGSWGLTDPEETRDIVTAASAHPRTRWCVTVVNDQGEAVAHACAHGKRPWPPGDPPNPKPPPGTSGQGPAQEIPDDPAADRPDGRATERIARLRDLLNRLGITPGSLEPIARGSCDHRHAESRYTPSRKLKHLIRARAQTCTAPGCGGQSFHADQDHVIPYPDGPTDECNLHAPCRAHHRAKQAPGWHVDQPQPGILRWRLPNGRTHTTRPTLYSL